MAISVKTVRTDSCSDPSSWSDRSGGEMDDHLRIMLVQMDEPDRSVILDHVDKIGEIELVTEVGSIDECYENLESFKPDILMLDLHSSSDSDKMFGMADRISIEFPDISIFVSSDIQEPQLILAALRSGAQEFFSKPLNPEDFRNSVERVVMKKRRAQRPDTPKNRIISIFSKKGGQGVTTIAVNLAAALATIQKERSAIFDADLQLGDITSFLDLSPQYNIIDTCNDDGEIDGTKLQSCMTHHDLGISILAEPFNPTDSANISASQIGQILTHLKAMYPYVVVDTPHAFEPKTIEALSLSDDIYLVTVPSIPAIRATRKCLDAFKELELDLDNVKIIVNRVGKRDRIKIADVENILEYPVTWSLPNNYKAAIQAIDAGIPLVGQKRLSDVAKRILHIAESIANGDLSGRGSGK
jgi:pilus assembly protein CpaE